MARCGDLVACLTVCVTLQMRYTEEHDLFMYVAKVMNYMAQMHPYIMYDLNTFPSSLCFPAVLLLLYSEWHG
jgi:hypothetical protein